VFSRLLVVGVLLILSGLLLVLVGLVLSSLPAWLLPSSAVVPASAASLLSSVALLLRVGCLLLLLGRTGRIHRVLALVGGIRAQVLPVAMVVAPVAARVGLAQMGRDMMVTPCLGQKPRHPRAALLRPAARRPY